MKEKKLIEKHSVTLRIFFFLRFVFTEVAFLAERSERASNLKRPEFKPNYVGIQSNKI